MTESFIEKLKILANSQTCFEFDPDYEHWQSGNYDDVYSEGVDDGQVQLAREILQEMGIDQ